MPDCRGVKFKGRQTVRSVTGYLGRHSSAFRLLLAETATPSTARFKVGEEGERGAEKPL